MNQPIDLGGVSFQQIETSDCLRFRLEGELDFHNSEAVEATIMSALEGWLSSRIDNQYIEIDCLAIRLADSTGISVLKDIRTALEQRGICYTASYSSSIKRLAEIIRITL